jgi:predicted dehydrogenase
VVCVAERLTEVTVDTEDVAALICRHGDGRISEVHLDYVQRAYSRGCHIAGELGTIVWEFASGCVRLFTVAHGTWRSIPQPEGWQLNQMYVDELRHLLDCVERRAPTALPIREGAEVVRIALAAKRSAQEERFVSTDEVV